MPDKVTAMATKPNTCTVRLAVSGLCGKPAVYTFTSSRGEVFSECAEHHEYITEMSERTHAPRPAVTTKSATFTHPVTGNKVRTTSGRRYIVVNDYGSKAVVVRRTNSLDNARHVARLDGPTAVVFDRFTGSVVA
jgi:hypothetical protein